MVWGSLCEEEDLLEDLNVVPVSEEKVIVNSEEEDEGEEESRGREEMPQVMVVKKVQNIAQLIFVPESR